MSTVLRMFRAVLPICLALSTLTACKTETKQAEAVGPPPTQVDGHNTSEFTAALTYARILQNEIQVAFMVRGGQPFTAACDDARFNIEIRPSLAIESCRVGIDATNNAQVAIKYSNGWAVLADPQDARQVDAAQLPSFK